MSEIPPRRRGGRPPLAPGERGESLSTVVRPQTYDEACRIARRRGMSVSAVLRVALERLIRDESARSVSY